jgi:hypothetical protein
MQSEREREQTETSPCEGKQHVGPYATAMGSLTILQSIKCILKFQMMPANIINRSKILKN